MTFESRVFQLAKDTDHPEQYQDAYALAPARGIAVVADGVASAIFSRQWAGILVEATVAEPPDPGEKEAFAQWLQQRRQTWAQQIDVSSLAWFQKAKLPAGAFSTLLWVRLLPVDEQQEGQFGACRLESFAIGDSCLFHVRHGEVLRTFPIQTSAELEADPIVLGSVDLKRDRLMEFLTLDEVCYPDDLLILCTDAVADWALRGIESGDPPAWDDYWNMSQQQWQDEIVALRNRRQMRYDDATLVLLRVGEQTVVTARPAEPAVRVEQIESQPQTEAAEEGFTGQPGDASQEDWKEKFKSASEQLAEGIELASNQALRGLKTWKEKAVRKVREKFRPHDK